MNYIKLSKEVSYALRHALEEYDLVLDKDGFVDIELLLNSLNSKYSREKIIDIEDIYLIMKNSDKNRLEIMGNKIRALYGHSTNVKVEKEETIPPRVLYHGTTNDAYEVILRDGLKAMTRQFVHLSTDIETAIIVGKRRDNEPIILEVDAELASKDGIKFYIGNDKIWLSDYIPAKYLKKI